MGLTRRCFMAAASVVVSVLDFFEPSSPAPMTPAPPPRQRIEVLDGDLPWGTYGKSGKEPLKWVRLDECSVEHLRAILRTQPQITQRYADAIKRVLRSRNE